MEIERLELEVLEVVADIFLEDWCASLRKL